MRDRTLHIKGGNLVVNSKKVFPKSLQITFILKTGESCAKHTKLFLKLIASLNGFLLSRNAEKKKM